MANTITAKSHIEIKDRGHGAITIGNDKPFVLFGGMNVLESKELAFEIAEQYVDICKRLGIGYVFKASFDKANRSSLHSYRGPGLNKGVDWLGQIKEKYKFLSLLMYTSLTKPNQWQKLLILFSCRPSYLVKQT